MATAPTKLMTAEEFFEFCHRPENRDRHFELERGEIVEMSLPGERHGVVCGNVTGILWTFRNQRSRGYVCPNDTGLVLERDPDTIRGADIAFYDENRRYDELDIKHTDHLPTLVVEVLSPNDRMTKMTRRITLFLKKGVQLVWVLDPESCNVTVYRRGREPVVLEADEEVTGEDILAEFHCKVGDFFAMAGQSA